MIQIFATAVINQTCGCVTRTHPPDGLLVGLLFALAYVGMIAYFYLRYWWDTR